MNHNFIRLMKVLSALMIVVVSLAGNGATAQMERSPAPEAMAAHTPIAQPAQHSTSTNAALITGSDLQATDADWTWQNPLPQGNSLKGVWGSSSNNVFAVGDLGTILHYDGSVWNTMSSNTTEPLYGVWGSSESDIFAVGRNGTILHYDGNEWSTMSSGITERFWGVWGSSDSDVFAVGDNGTILHYDGSAWSAMSSGTTERLWELWGSSNDDVFAVGYNGTILHYDGSGWSAMSSGTTNWLEGVWGSSNSDVFAVGYKGTILHYNGSTWSAMTSRTSNWLFGVWGSGSSDVFAVGSGGTILHYDGSGWSEISSGTSSHLNGVWGNSGSNVFAVGDLGTILHYDGNEWSAMSSCVTIEELYEVWGSSGSNVFAVGDWGTILHYDGFAWNAMNSGTTTTLEGVWGSSGSDVFAVGNGGTILYYDGSVWSMMSSGITEPLRAVWGSSDNSIFAVGENGTILHYDDSEWNAMSSGTTEGLWGVWGSGGSDVFAVGYNGTILHYDGNEWSAMSSGTTNWLHGVWGSSGSDVFAVGGGPMILHYDGSEWSAMSTNTTQALYGVWGNGNSDVFAVGATGSILHYDGSGWSAMSSGTTANWLEGVWGSSGSDVFAVGSGGMILNYGGDANTPESSADAPLYANVFPIPVFWTASAGDSGVASTTLWVKFGSAGTWASTGLTQSGTSGTFNYTPTQNEGRYYFATVATDNAGNVEPAPTGDGDTYTHYDITPPNSQVQVPELERTVMVQLPWTVNDNLSGVSSTRLWVKFGTQGTWTATDLFQAGASGAFEYNFTQGEGIYYFATVATDRAGNQENAPTGTGDGGCEHQLYTSPSVPTLDTIVNSDGDGNYIVSWSSVNDATSYTLQEATDSAFTGATTVYSGSNTSTSISSKSPGTYYYRVRASNAAGDSAWSNAEPVTVTQTNEGDAYEPDDTCAQARAIPTNGAVQERTFHQQADEDWVMFEATAGVSYRIEGQVPAGSPADVTLELHGQCAGLPFDTQNPTFAPGVRLDFEAPTSGAYYMRWTNGDPTMFGDTVAYHISVRALGQEPTPGAVVIVAGRYKVNDPLQPNIHYAAEQVYQVFQAHGYTTDRIYYLATNPALPGYNASATAANLQAAITTWATTKVGPERPFTLYMVDHGKPNELYLDRPAGQWVSPAQVDTWLGQLEAEHPELKINVIVEACHSGSFIGLPQTVSKSGRVVISSTGVGNLAYASSQGAIFSDHFVAALYQGQSLYQSFQSARWATQNAFPHQTPWLDDDGDSLPNQPGDGQAAALRGFTYAGTLSGDVWPPHIFEAVGPSQITQGRGIIRAEVRDDKQVKRVWAVIYPPSYRPPETGEELVSEVLPTIVLQAQSNAQFAATYTGFDELGLYRVVVYAEDNDGLEARPVAVEVRTGWGIYLPLVVRQQEW